MRRRRSDEAARRSKIEDADDARHPPLPEPREGELVANRWRVGAKLGSGSFGAVVEVTEQDGGKTYAMKMETRTRRSQLKYEARCYEQLRGVAGLPRIFEHGRTPDFTYLVMEHIGEPLDKLQQRHGGTLTLEVACVIGCQAVQRLKDVHAKGLVHRDIKPGNFTLRNGTVFLCDFGLAKSYVESGGVHAPFRDDKRLTGTPRFASLHTHRGMEQSRRDDLESLIYMLVYLVKGRLPWQGLKKRDDEQGGSKDERIAKVKADSEETLCEGMPALQTMYASVRRLEYEAAPPYQLYCACLRAPIRDRGEGQ